MALSVLAETIRRRMFELDIRTVKALEEKAGVPKDTVRNLMSGRTKSFRNDKLEAVARALDMPIDALLTARQTDKNTPAEKRAAHLNTFNVPFYDVRASMGPGAFNDAERVIGHVPFQRDWLERIVPGDLDHLAVVEAIGDSMVPTIMSGDRVVLNLAATSLVDGDVFALLLQDSLLIKRVFIAPGGIELRSDNPEHPAWTISRKEADDIRVIGHAAIKVGRLH